jgi:hypothetical protein
VRCTVIYWNILACIDIRFSLGISDCRIMIPGECIFTFLHYSSSESTFLTKSLSNTPSKASNQYLAWNYLARVLPRAAPRPRALLALLLRAFVSDLSSPFRLELARSPLTGPLSVSATLAVSAILSVSSASSSSASSFSSLSSFSSSFSSFSSFFEDLPRRFGPGFATGVADADTFLCAFRALFDLAAGVGEAASSP